MSLTIALRSKAKETDEDLLLFPEAQGPSGRSWLSHDEEGRLAVDVSETENEIIVLSAIAGVRPEDLEVSVHADMLTIRGRRGCEEEPGAKALVRECHWGAFSRSVILSAEIDAECIGATIKDGVLTIRLPKLERRRRIGVHPWQPSR